VPFFRRGSSQSTTTAPVKVGLADNLPSEIMNSFGNELNLILPEPNLLELRASTANLIPSVTASHEHLRALMLLDWVTRTCFATWARIVPESGDKLASALHDLPEIRDAETAAAVGNLVALMSDVPENSAQNLADNYDRDNFFDDIAVVAAEKASADAFRLSFGPTVADIAATAALNECRAARVDVALAAIAGLSLTHSLDGLWPFIMSSANGPGDLDAKKISIRNLAPFAAFQPLETTVKRLQNSVGALYANLVAVG
jgi:hypothetical protein